MHSTKRKNGCGARVFNKGSAFKGDKWHIELFNDHYATEKCAYYWKNDNTVDISEPQ